MSKFKSSLAFPWQFLQNKTDFEYSNQLSVLLIPTKNVKIKRYQARVQNSLSDYYQDKNLSSWTLFTNLQCISLTNIASCPIGNIFPVLNSDMGVFFSSKVCNFSGVLGACLVASFCNKSAFSPHYLMFVFSKTLIVRYLLLFFLIALNDVALFPGSLLYSS